MIKGELNGNVGVKYFLSCMFVFLFFVYSEMETNSKIDIPHFTISIMPLYIVIGITVLFITLIIFIKRQLKVDFIVFFLLFRLVIHIIPIAYTNVSIHFGVNFSTSLLCLVTYIIVINGKDNKDKVFDSIRLIFTILCIQTISEMLLGEASYLDNTYYYKHDLYIPIGGSNSIASKILPCFAYIYIYDSKKWWKIVYSVLCIVSVGLTKSRSGIITGLFLMSIFSILDTQANKKAKVKFIFSIAIIGLIFLLFIEKTEVGKLAFSESDSTFNVRIEKWMKGFRLFLEHPIFGNGFSVDVISNEPHNYIIYILMRSGITGMIVFISIVLTVVRKVKLYFKDPVIKGMACFVICILVQGLAEVVLFSYSNDIMLWFAIGIMMSRVNAIVAYNGLTSKIERSSNRGRCIDS